VEKLTSILVVASRTDSDRALLEKAVHLARSIGAQINLFSCDANLARVLRHSYAGEETEKAWHICMEEHLAYLRSLRTAARAPDIQICVDAACRSPLHEGIIDKIKEVSPDLVMKCPSGTHPLRRFAFDANDWQLMRECPVTLMLVRSRPWRPTPKFAALVSVDEESTARLAETIIHTSEYFSLGCHGELDVVYSENSEDAQERKNHAIGLERITREYRIGAKQVHVLNGNPEETLPEFVARNQYDALILGALTHRKGLAAVAGTLTSKLVDALDCDFILVKRTGTEQPEQDVEAKTPGETHDTPADQAPPRHESSTTGSSVLWQALFGD